MKLADVKGLADLPNVSKKELIDLITELAVNLSREGNWQFDRTGKNYKDSNGKRINELIRENILGVQERL